MNEIGSTALIESIESTGCAIRGDMCFKKLTFEGLEPGESVITDEQFCKELVSVALGTDLAFICARFL